MAPLKSNMLSSTPALGVERIVTDAAGVPVVLDEPDDRRLIRLRVVDEIGLGIRRDDKQRQPRSIAAPALILRRGAVGAAQSRVRQGVRGRSGRDTVGDALWSYQPSESS